MSQTISRQHREDPYGSVAGYVRGKKRSRQLGGDRNWIPAVKNPKTASLLKRHTVPKQAHTPSKPLQRWLALASQAQRVQDITAVLPQPIGAQGSMPEVTVALRR